MLLIFPFSILESIKIAILTFKKMHTVTKQTKSNLKLNFPNATS